MAAPSISTYRPAGSLTIATALAPYGGTWDRRLAGHLLRRAGFGGTPDDISRLTALRSREAVSSLVDFNAKAVVVPPMDARPRPGSAGRMRVGLSQDQKDALRKQFNQTKHEQELSLREWWLNQMLTTTSPLQEKMTLFLSGHFTTAAVKQIAAIDLAAQNDLFRRNALGNFRSLTLAVSRDPAMLHYLDNTVSTKDHPNENYARELMELFTLGIGNYTETDVRESARAFTGWQAPGPNYAFEFNGRAHDNGMKTFLGKTGNFDGKDIVDIIFQQPAASKYLATKLLDFFLYNDPEPELVDAFAAVIRTNNFELKPSLATLFNSNVFFSDRAYRALVKSPVEFVIGSYQLFGITQVDRTSVNTLGRMGQILFYPPNVKGWDGGATWLTSQTVLTRENFASALAGNPKMTSALFAPNGTTISDVNGAAKRLIDSILLGDVSPASRSQLVSYLSGSDVAERGMLSGENYDERIRGAAYLTMAMPAFQLN